MTELTIEPAYTGPTGPNDAAMAAVADKAAAETAAAEALQAQALRIQNGETPPAPAPTPAATTPERPGWLPQKFKTPEELAAAYAEAEKKIAAGTKTPATPPVVSDAELEAFSREVVASGDLSLESYAKLAEKGIPRSLVDAHVSGLKAQRDAAIAEVTSAVGGPEAYAGMVEWARETLPPAELEAYNQIMRSGNKPAVLQAVKGLQAQFAVAGGPAAVPTRLSGRTAGGGVQPFTSQEDVVLAMRDPRYFASPEYRAHVEARLAASPF